MYDLKGSKKLLSSTEDWTIFEDLEGSRPRPRPRTSKTVLEAETSALHAFPTTLHFKPVDIT